MANLDNLTKMGKARELSTEEAQKIGSKGGKASVKAKRERKSMQELAKIILGLSMTSGQVHNVEDIQNIAEIKGKNLTVDQAILLKQVEKALKGDLQSATFIRDTSGNKPVEKVEKTEVPKIIDDV